MNKKKWTKVVLVTLFVIVAGIFYSCRMNQKEEAILSFDNQEDTGLPGSVNQSDELGSSELSDLTTDENIDATDVKIATSNTDEIYVYICGEVQNPAVYKVAKTARVFEVIAVAGGLTEAAAEEYINQALTVSDGQQIYVPSSDEVEEILLFEADNVSSNETPDNTGEVIKQEVNINTADATELMTLSGIGQAKAQAIIEYRNNNGDFKTIEDIMQIDGIKESVYEKIKDKIRVD